MKHCVVPRTDDGLVFNDDNLSGKKIIIIATRLSLHFVMPLIITSYNLMERILKPVSVRPIIVCGLHVCYTI